MRHWNWTYTVVLMIELTLAAGIIYLLFGCSSSRRLTATSTAAHQAHVSQVDSGSTVATRDSSGIHVSNTHTETNTETSDTERIVERDSTIIYEHADGTRDVERHHSRTRTTEKGARTAQTQTEDKQDTATVTASTMERRGSVHKADSSSTQAHEETRKEKKSIWPVWISGIALIVGLVTGILLPLYLTRRK